MAKLTAVILTGGRSSRMGRDKALLQHPAGGTFLSRAIALLGHLDPHLSVGADGEKYADFGVMRIPDRWPDIGPMGGIASSLEALQEPILAVACDTPLLTRALIDRLTSAFEQHPEASCICFRTDGFVQPLCAVYTEKTLDRLRALIGQGRYALRPVVEGPEALRLTLTDEEARQVAENVNTPEEYARLTASPDRRRERP